MNTTKDKCVYTTPTIERVEFDNEISMTLQSAPPAGPDEFSSIPNNFNNDPFKTPAV